MGVIGRRTLGWARDWGEVGIFHAAMMGIVKQNITARDVKQDNVGVPPSLDQIELVDRGIMRYWQGEEKKLFSTLDSVLIEVS